MKKVDTIKWLETKLGKMFDKKDINEDYSDFDKTYEQLADEQCVKEGNRQIGFTDNACVVMVSFKKDNLAKWFRATFDAKPSLTPILTYTDAMAIPKVKLSTDYIRRIMDAFGYEDSVSIKVKNDYPITIENEDMVFILAPRVDGD